jgi:predicted metalloprotease with PDZ domain
MGFLLLQIFTVQLSRRWCSRLGFSLQGSNGHTYISAIYPDSVAAKDGRLRVGDEVIMVRYLQGFQSSESLDKGHCEILSNQLLVLAVTGRVDKEGSKMI